MRRQQSIRALLRAVAPAHPAPRAQRNALTRAHAVPAAATVVPSAISTDHGGTVYPVPPSGAKVYANVDGHRIDDGRYTNFKGDLAGIVPSERIYTDPVRVFAYGTDASFYRLLPQMVVKIHDEKEVTRILPKAKKHSTPVTFRAAGTSLSGQAVTDSILLKLSHTGKNFRNYEITVRGDDDPSPPQRSASTITKTPENLMTQRIKYFPRADAFSPSGTPRLRASRPRD